MKHSYTNTQSIKLGGKLEVSNRELVISSDEFPPSHTLSTLSTTMTVNIIYRILGAAFGTYSSSMCSHMSR